MNWTLLAAIGTESVHRTRKKGGGGGRKGRTSGDDVRREVERVEGLEPTPRERCRSRVVGLEMGAWPRRLVIARGPAEDGAHAEREFVLLHRFARGRQHSVDQQDIRKKHSSKA